MIRLLRSNGVIVGAEENTIPNICADAWRTVPIVDLDEPGEDKQLKQIEILIARQWMKDGPTINETAQAILNFLRGEGK